MNKNTNERHNFYYLYESGYNLMDMSITHDGFQTAGNL